MTVQEENELLKKAIQELLTHCSGVPRRVDAATSVLAFPHAEYFEDNYHVECPALIALDGAGVIKLSP